MTSPRFEAFLARLYVDAKLRAEFLARPRETAQGEGLSETESEALAAIDRVGLELASRSYAAKRAKLPR